MDRAVPASAKSAAIVAGWSFVAEFAVSWLVFSPFKWSLSDVISILISSAFWAVVIMPIGYVVALIATCVFAVPPFLILQAKGRAASATRTICGLGGFAVGTLIWLVAIYRGSPPGAMMFEWWGSALIVGGLAGAAGGMAFSRTALSDRGLLHDGTGRPLVALIGRLNGVSIPAR